MNNTLRAFVAGLAICAIAVFAYLWQDIPEPASAISQPAKVVKKGKRRYPQPKHIATYPHDDKAFTQGLLVHNGFLYESTGLHGQSSLRKVDIKTGKVLKQYDIKGKKYFGEGIDLWGKEIVFLT